MVTLRDVAKAAGVSVSTASYALNGRPEVKEETSKKVLEAASKLNYMPNGAARDLKMSRTDTIGLILSNLSGPFYSGLIDGIEEITLSMGYNLIVCSSSGGKNSTAVKMLYEKRTDGMIVMASDIEDEIILQAANENFPIILMDRELNGKYVWDVMVNNRKGASEAVTHLVKIGYKSIGYMTGPMSSFDNIQRFEGYKEVLRENNLPYFTKWLLHGQFTKNSGYRAAQALIAGGDFPEAIFCANDEMAIGAIEAFNESNIKVPEDIAIVGFDNIELASYIKPALTTVKHPKYYLGRIAAQMLMQALNKDFNIKNVKLDAQLIIRDSCGYNLRKKV